MATQSNIELLDEYLQTPDFYKWSEKVTGELAGDSDYTIGEILSNDSLRLNSYLQSEYLLERAEAGDQRALELVDDRDKEIANAMNQYLMMYAPSEVNVPPSIDPVDPQPRRPIIPIPVLSGLSRIPVVEDVTEYSGITESLLNQEDRQELIDAQVNPDRIFEGDSSFYQKWLRGSDPIDADSPWRVKASFFPVNMTPFEAEKLLQNEYPDAELRYINPNDRGMGLAIRVPRKDGAEGEQGEWVALRPQFGYEMLTEETLTMLGQEITPILVEMGLYGGYRKLVKDGIKEAGELLRKESTVGGKIKKGAATATIAGVSAGMGRFLQLAYGNTLFRDEEQANAIIAQIEKIEADTSLEEAEREAAVSEKQKELLSLNNVSIERAFEDAGLAAALAGAGTLVIGGVLGGLSTGWKAITGSNIPNEILARLQAKISTKGKTPEFSSGELAERTKKAAIAVADEAGTFYRPPAGELTQDDFFKALELELFAQLSPTAKGREVYQSILDNNEKASENFWQELTENAPELEGISYNDFRDYLGRQQEEYAERAAEASRLRQREIEEQTDLETVLPDQDPEAMLTVDELGSTFTRDVESGGLVYKRNSPEFLYQYDEQYKTAKDAVNAEVSNLADLKYDRVTDSTALIRNEFTEALGGGESRDKIMRTLGEVEASDVIKSMIPMRDGVSILKQLMGVGVDEKGQFLKQADLTFGQLNGMYHALNNLFMTSSDREVRQIATGLRDAVEAQMDDLITFQARKELSAGGIDSPTPDALRGKIQEIAGPLMKAQEALSNLNTSIERKFIRELVDKEPSQIADFVLSASPKQIEDLLGQIYKSPDSIVRLGNLRQLVVNNIRKSMGGLPLTEQNKEWGKFLDKNKEQLQALFPEADFLKLTEFKKVQEQALAEIAQVTESLTQLEKELGKPPADFVKDFLLAGKSARLAGKADMSLAEFNKVLQETPELQPYVTALVRDFMRDNFEKQQLDEGGLFQTDNFDVSGFINFINQGLRAGPQGTARLGSLFSQLLGKDVGNQYAKDLRAFGKLLDRGTRRGPKSPVAQGSAATGTIEDFLEETSFAIRMFIPPLTQTGRRVTAFLMGYRDKARSDMLEILADPTKLNKLLEARDRSMGRREFFKFLGALAISREVNIGSEERETAEQRALKAIEGPTTGIMDLYSRVMSI